MTPESSSKVLHHTAQHAKIDEMLKASDVPYTILKPHFFMENAMMASQAVALEGVVYMAMNDSRKSMIDMHDIAYGAIKVLTEAGHKGKTYTLTDPA